MSCDVIVSGVFLALFFGQKKAASRDGYVLMINFV